MRHRFEQATDPISGLPYPINPSSTSQFQPSEETNRHHHFYPAEDLEVGLGNEAVRHVRVQEIATNLHWQYHHTMQKPRLPQTPGEKYRAVVLAAAGYIPEKAIAFDDKGTPYQSDLSETERLELWRTNKIRIESPELVRKFLLEYTMRHGQIALDPGLIDEFLQTANIERRIELGQRLLLLAAEAATESLQEMYSEARRARFIPPERSRRVGNFVCNTVLLGARGVIRHRALHRMRPYLLTSR